MQVRENTPTANIRSYTRICANIAYIQRCASLRIRESDAWPSLIGTVSAGGLYTRMLSMQWFLARGLVEAHYLGAELRCISAIWFGDALLWCIITMQYCGALSRCVIAMFIAMHCLGAFCDALSQCIIAGRYRDAAVQFFIAISSLVTFVMHYRGAFRDVS